MYVCLLYEISVRMWYQEIFRLIFTLSHCHSYLWSEGWDQLVP